MNKLSIVSISIAAALAISLTACGDSSSNNTSSPSQNTSVATTTISGVVAADVVNGSTVTLYALDQNGVQGGIIGVGKTDANGNYSINISGATVIGGGILAVATNGTYIDQATNQTTTLSVMQAATSSITSQTLNITPMSSAAWIIAQGLLAQDGLHNAIAIATDEAQTFVGAGLNSPIAQTTSKSSVSQTNSSYCATPNNTMLAAISNYQYNSQSSLSEAIAVLATEMATNLPAATLSSTSIAPVSANYAQISATCPTPPTPPTPTCNLNATDFTTQLASGPFSFSNTKWSGQFWGPNVNSYQQAVCTSSAWQQERVLYSYENIAVASQWNYCHHHSPNWYPGAQYSVNVTAPYNDELSLYCSPNSFYISGNTASSIDFRTQSSQITNAYRWNSAYAQANIANWKSLVSQETNASEMQAFLNKIYPTPKSGTTMIDSSWYDFSYLITDGKTANLQSNATPTKNYTYPRQSNNQALNGVDCSDLTAWAYQISLNKSFSSAVSNQAGQLSGNNTSQEVCQNPKLQAPGAAGSFVVVNGSTISAATINNNNRSDILNNLQSGDLLFIQGEPNITSVTHVITWTGKKIGAAGSALTATSVPLELIAPVDVGSGTSRTIGDWVIIDSHFQGADYRDFSGWYVNSLWGVRRVINPQNTTCK